MIIAIDGPAGAGKSSVTKAIASELGLMRLDTGAIYRAVALACFHKGVSSADSSLGAFVKSLDLTFSGGGVLLNGRDVSSEIRTDLIGGLASEFAAMPAVRAGLLALQRQIASEGDFVVDGRDIGTVVFPNAEVKLFLTASVDARAKRRFLEYQGLDNAPTLDDVRAAILERDENDSGRSIAPLRRAIDAIEVDSSEMTIEQTVDTCLRVIRDKVPHLGA